MVAEGETETLILGIGNVLWADEGFGVRCVEALQQRFAFEGGVPEGMRAGGVDLGFSRLGDSGD